MWKQKIGISIANNCTPEVIETVAKTGFEAVSPSMNGAENLDKTVEVARKCGLEIQSVHAPFEKAADMWSEDGSASAPAKAELIKAVEECHRFEVPVAVVHTWIGFDYTFNPTEAGFENYGEIVELAEKYGVKIAFENTEGEEYLFALTEHFKDSKTVGFCWDSGHEMCYNRSSDLLEKLGDRLIMTHLNDNLGVSRFDGRTFWTDDLHLLPYDGIADWDYNIARLKKAKRLEILNFELNISSKPNRHENDVYGEMSLERYFAEAYKRACRIASRYSD